MSLRIALAQFDFPVGAVAANAAKIATLIAEARDKHQADLVLFPELSLSGYPPEDLLLRPAFLADCQQAIERIAADVQGITAVIGWPQAVGSVWADAVAAMRAAVAAVVARFPVVGVTVWQVVGAACAGRLLAPGWPTGSINTSSPWAGWG